jgi:serine/threonine-protein kinase
VTGSSFADRRGNLGRYALYGEIAAGGMATVHLGRLLGSVGFARTVAIKRLHPHLSRDPDFVGMFLEEARLAARVRHPNVVSTLDVVSEDGELFLVMEYVAGETLSRLVRKTREAKKRVPPRYVVGVMAGALEGLHAAHEATSERGVPLGMVHRDVSPQNIHIGIDGVSRVLDFGIAKATNRVQDTRTDQIKGKVAYMSPEQLAKAPADRSADIYSASVVLWEALTGHRLFQADDVPALVYAIVNEEVFAPSSLVPDLPPGLDDIVMRGLDRDPRKRWATAREMAAALENVLAPAPAREIGQWVTVTAGEALTDQQALVRTIESATTTTGMGEALRRDSPGRPLEISSGVVPTGSTPDEGGDDARAGQAAPPGASGRETLLEGSVARATAKDSAVPRLVYGSSAEVDEDDRETLVHAGAKSALVASGDLRELAAAPTPDAPGPPPSSATADAVASEAQASAPHGLLVKVLAGAVVVLLAFLVAAVVTSLLEPEPESAPATPPASGTLVERTAPHASAAPAPPAPHASAAPAPTSMLAPVTKPRPSAVPATKYR